MNLLSTPQTNIDTSESVINKLRQENDSLRRELISEKEHNNGLIEERESLKLVFKLLSRDLYHRSNNSTSLPKENGNDNINVDDGNINFVDDTISTPIGPPVESLSSAKTTVILGDSIIQNLQGYKLGKETNERVVVKSFSGATTQDIISKVRAQKF